MSLTPPEERRRLESLDRRSLASHQMARLNALCDAVLPQNRFYAEKFAGTSRPIRSLEELARLPLTTKDELLASGSPEHFAANLTYPINAYCRCHQTSGSRGHPMVVLDTAADWEWWIDVWQYVLDAADVTSDDRVMTAFSFGPFVGFWSAFDAAWKRGCLVVPGGGTSTVSRLEMIRRMAVTVVLCTPSYALHMAEVAAERGFDLGAWPVRVLVVAGEPGGSSPAVRGRIEQAWQATVLDHSGATEVGPWGFGDRARRGLHVTESEFLPEFLSLETGEGAAEGELAELVLTNLGRAGCPLIRYRTGDLVRPVWNHDEGVRFVLLDGGVLGRVDDMMIIRGVNVFPSAVEEIVRSFPSVAEFRMTARKVREMDQLTLEIEDAEDRPDRVAEALQLRLGLKIDVLTAPPGTLPRFEAKGNRFVDERGAVRGT